MRKIIYILVLILVAATSAQAAFRESPQLYRGLRPLGMGNAFIGVSDDHNAMFYNPAGLNDVERFRIEVLNPTVTVSYNVVNIVKSVLDVMDDLGDEAGGASAVFEDVVGANLGKFTSFKVAMSPGLTMKNFAVKVVGEASGYFSFRNKVFPNIEYEAKIDSGVIIGGAYGFWDKW